MFTCLALTVCGIISPAWSQGGTIFPTTRSLNAPALAQATELLKVTSDVSIEPKGMTWEALGDRLERDCLSGSNGISDLIAKLRSTQSDPRKQFFIFYMALTAVVKNEDRESFVNKFGGIPAILPLTEGRFSERGTNPMKFNWPWDYEPGSRFNFRARFYMAGNAARVQTFWQQAKADNIFSRLRN